MSDYTPITGELRDTLKRAKCTFTNSAGFEQVNVTKDALDSMLDAIDAIHANLERENDRLRCELDRVQGKQEERDGCVELPKDADGEYVHVGDMLAGEKAGGFGLCEPFEVGCILFGKDIIQVNDAHGLARCIEFAHHYAPDTWERIIADALGSRWSAPDELSPDFIALVARCKALCERAKEGDAE